MTKKEQNRISTELLEDALDLINEDSSSSTKLDAIDNMLYIAKDFSHNKQLIQKIHKLTSLQSGDKSVYFLHIQNMLKSIGDEPVDL